MKLINWLAAPSVSPLAVVVVVMCTAFNVPIIVSMGAGLVAGTLSEAIRKAGA